MGRILHIRFALLCLASQWCTTGAWAPVGHDRIARIAEHLLVGKHKDQIRTMMHSDLPDVSEYEKKMTIQYPETSPLHWHRQDPEWTCDSRGGLGGKEGHVRCDGHGATNGSLFCALAYFFEHFAHDALLKEFPEPKEPIGTPASLPALQKIPSKDQSPAQYLRWLVILVGDLHQPLHWLHQHNYGRDIEIYYKEEKHTLLQFWEEYIPSHLLHKLETGMQPFMIDKDYEHDSKNWAHKVPTELFREWAKEVAEKVCGEVYHPMTVNHADGPKVDSPFTLTEELFQKWVKLAEELLQLSGERLGFVLNEIIEHKRHKDAHKDGRALPSRKVAVTVEKKIVDKAGKEVKTTSVPQAHAPGPKPAAGHHKPQPSATHVNNPKIDIGMWYKQLKIEERRRTRSNAMYNVFIAIVLVPLLLGLFTWHERIGGGNLLRLAKLKM